jgi:hypothetical protein
LKADVLVTEQGVQALVRDVVDHPLGHQESASFDRLHVENGRS